MTKSVNELFDNWKLIEKLNDERNKGEKKL